MAIALSTTVQQKKDNYEERTRNYKRRAYLGAATFVTGFFSFSLSEQTEDSKNEIQLLDKVVESLHSFSQILDGFASFLKIVNDDLSTINDHESTRNKEKKTIKIPPT